MDRNKVIIAQVTGETGTYVDDGMYTNNSGETDWYSYEYEMYLYSEYSYDDTETNENGYSVYTRYTLFVTKGHSNSVPGGISVTVDNNTVTVTGEGKYVLSDWEKYGGDDDSFRIPYEGEGEFTQCCTFWANAYVGNTVISSTYFEWKPIPCPTFYLVYDCNGGSNGPSSVPYEWLGTTYTDLENRIYVSKVVPTKEGYAFLGWSKDINATIAEFVYKQYPDLNENVPLEYEGTTLYAVWKEELPPQSVYFDGSKIYARDFVVEEGLTTVEIDNQGNVYAAAFTNGSFGIKKGTIYAEEFKTGLPE